MAEFGVILCVLFVSCVFPSHLVHGNDYSAVTGHEYVRKYESPVTVKSDINIAKSGTLTIEPGVEMRFYPGVGINVKGTLIAQGVSADRITLTWAEGREQMPDWPDDIRLVDTKTVMEGRLEIKYRGRWRGVCAHSQNWTDIDTNVTCRQLGFRGGNFSFGEWARNSSLFMLYHKPQCRGDEGSVMDCPGNARVQIGGRICENQQTIHLRCEGLASNVAQNYWKGIELYNSTHKTVENGDISIVESASVFEHVDIYYAGVDEQRLPVPALRASPHPPFLVECNILYSALDATNFTYAKASTVMRNSVIAFSRGHGLYGESEFGRIHVHGSEIFNNSGAGVRVKLMDTRYIQYDDREKFCQRPNLGSQSFPQIIVGEPISQLGGSCSKTFTTEYGKVITLNFLEMEIDKEITGELEVYDGDELNKKLISRIPIVNSTLPQGLTGTLYQMTIVFRWTKPEKYRYSPCPILQECVKFTIMIDTDYATVPEIKMTNSKVTKNLQHGVYLENIRNYVFVNMSTISHNGYGGGLVVFGGAGDIHVNESTVEHNRGNAVNITYHGGRRMFNQSSFSFNYGNGINITLNETMIDNRTHVAKQQRTEISYSRFEANEGIGVRFGNFCTDSRTLPWVKGDLVAWVNDSQFISNRGDGVEYESCFQKGTDTTNFTVGFNHFESNYGHGVRVSPLLNTIGRIANNTFIDHPRYTLLVDNTDKFLESRAYEGLPVNYFITGNLFRVNQGIYVANVRLTQGSTLQTLKFMYNSFENNVVQGAFPGLNERTRSTGVVILSSSNVVFERNRLQNPLSIYEVATHLQGQKVQLHCQKQWWGTTDYEKIVMRIFDRESRYNLADMNYHPVLKYDNLYTSKVTDDQEPQLLPFDRGSKIGGLLGKAFSTLTGKVYQVDRDINILPHGSFTISPGTVLEFGNAISMYAEGPFYAGVQNANDRTPGNRVVFKYAEDLTFKNNSKVRLVDGQDSYEGRVEVRMNNGSEWGTICNKGWTLKDASIVCQMLGLVVHPDDWRPDTYTQGPAGQPIWLSNVDCTDMDLDITTCKADQRDDHSCNHTMDVSVRCKPPTWGGIHMAAVLHRPGTRLTHVLIQEAGLMDPTAITYAPALMIEYNYNFLDYVEVRDCKATAIEIRRVDPFASARITYANISNNIGSGIVTRSPYMRVLYSTFTDNLMSGLEYNPFFSADDGRDFRNTIHNPTDLSTVQSIQLGTQELRFFITTQNSADQSWTKQIPISAYGDERVVIDVMDYNPDTSQENVTILDSRPDSITGKTYGWAIEDDLVDFPVVSSGPTVTFRWKVTGKISGRLTLAVRSKPFNWQNPFARLDIRNCTFVNNKNGLFTRYYNQPSNENLDLYVRHRYENINVYGNRFHRNREDAMMVPSITKYHELYLPTVEDLQRPHRVAELFYNVESCTFTENGGGIRGEHNHIEFSNNVWLWEITFNRFQNNKNGGISIELPKLTDLQDRRAYDPRYDDRYNYEFIRFNHSVDINDTWFEDNSNFECWIGGFYANMSVARNHFLRNTCTKSCLAIEGTEKDADIHDNIIRNNIGRSMLEFNMKSHAPYTQYVYAQIVYNDIKQNKKPDNLQPRLSSRPTSYAVGIRGLQNVTVNRNLLSNSLDFELIGGQAANSLSNYLDVRANYWGTRDQTIIQEKIFDFDDWNSYAIAEYFPYLLYDDFQSVESPGSKLENKIDLNKPFGGRVEGQLKLVKRPQPYEINRDLTIMPTGSLIIDPGVKVRVYPNVGILVLGTFSAIGYRDQRISLSPVLQENKTTTVYRTKRNVPPEIAQMLRFRGGDDKNEGFLELYNKTERRWTIVCDPFFNDRTAEVACRSMSKESTNVIVRRIRHYDHVVFGYPLMHEQKVEWFWRNTFICDGSEEHLGQCRYKINYNIRTCMENRNYVFLRCGERNIPEGYDYWGNIRFTTAQYEHGDISGDPYNYIEYTDIYGAGILHQEKVASVQAVYKTPKTNATRISNCAQNGYDYIAPKDEFEITFNRIEKNNGYAFGGLALNGESRETLRSSFTPLVESTIPYNLYGLVRMCTSEKEIWFTDRILLYFKYNFEVIDCMKIIRCRVREKKIALRMLQFNLYDDRFHQNYVAMFNGDWMFPSEQIGLLTANSSVYEKAIKYETRENVDVMTVRVEVSPAHGEFGFIAEVVSLPLSPVSHPGLGLNRKQKIKHSSMNKNQGGGFSFRNVGEVNPSVIIEGNRLQDNGVKILNVTSPDVINCYVQNSRLLTIANNFIGQNYGGVYVYTTTFSVSNAMFANVTNNVITFNSHGSSFFLDGHHFQNVDVRGNYISHNNIEYRNVSAIFGVNANFTSNVLVNNTGGCIFNATTLEKVSIYQRIYRNHFYENVAIGWYKTTVYVGTAKHKFANNFFYNKLNNFEMVTYNRTKMDWWKERYIDHVYPTVDARNNWWGSKYESYVRGRIWDRGDDDNLIGVDYNPYHMSNSSVLQGRCHPGWRLNDDKCYYYFGGVLPYDEAERQCQWERSKLAWARTREDEQFFGELVASSQSSYHDRITAWVFYEYPEPGKCTALQNYKIEHYQCDQLKPFICEKDPYIRPKMDWRLIIIILSSLGGALFILILLLVFWKVKSVKRTEQRLERRNSMRASIRSSKSVIANQMALQNEKRRRPPLGKLDDSGHLDLSGVTLEDSSTDSIDKAKLEAMRPSTPASTIDYSIHENSSYYDSDLHDHYVPRIENEISNILARPIYDNMYENKAFDERSLDRSRLRIAHYPNGDRRATPSPVRPRMYSNDRAMSTSRSTSRHSLDDEKPKPLETDM